MSEKAAEFLVLFFVRLAAVLAERHKRTLKDEESQQQFEEKIELSRRVRTEEETANAASDITNKFQG